MVRQDIVRRHYFERSIDGDFDNVVMTGESLGDFTDRVTQRANKIVEMGGIIFGISYTDDEGKDVALIAYDIHMRKSLFIAWHPLSIAYYLSHFYDKKFPTYVMLDEDYNKADREPMQKLLERCVELGYFKGIMTRTDLRLLKVDSLICMSYLKPYNMDIINRVDYLNLYLLEEGYYDYLNPDDSDEALAVYKEAIGLFSLPDKAKLKDCYYDIYRLSFKRILPLFCKVLGINLDELPIGVDCVLMTSPIEPDFGITGAVDRVKAYLGKEFKGKRILIKKHPRDTVDYSSTEYEAIEVDKSIPGQVIDGLYDVPKVYMYPSTVLLTTPGRSQVTLLRFQELIGNEKYDEAFESPIVKEYKVRDLKR